MSEKDCPFCGEPDMPSGTTCPKCGTAIPKHAKRDHKYHFDQKPAGGRSDAQSRRYHGRSRDDA